MAACCSNWKRVRMEVLASMTMPTRRGKIDLLAEGVDPGRRLLVVEQGKIALLQVGNVVAVPVGHRKDEVNFVRAAGWWVRWRRPPFGGRLT